MFKVDITLPFHPLAPVSDLMREWLDENTPGWSVTRHEKTKKGLWGCGYTIEWKDELIFPTEAAAMLFKLRWK